MFDQILDLVGQPPGSLVYHFIILFAVEFAVGISFGQWMRERDNKTARLTIVLPFSEFWAISPMVAVICSAAVATLSALAEV